MRTKLWLERLKERDHSGRATIRWEDNIEMDIEEIGLEVVDWIHLAQDMGQ
jgi:dephospho-CoA kinase